MKCPGCDNEYVCDCSSCKKRNPDVVSWRHFVENDIDYESCPSCGKTESMNKWMDIEYEQYEAVKKKGP